MAAKCLECGEAIQGRADKKFCDDQCRNTYNNKLNSDSNNYVRRVNNILRKNRRILAELNPTGKTTCKKTDLSNKGYNFDYFTSRYTTKAGKEYLYNYEQGILALEDDWYMLVVKMEYSDKGE
ncbi:MAG: hypothetical protein ACJAZ3_000069 [Sphingobacteriales bacterium]|jgi:hypothetical protein